MFDNVNTTADRRLTSVWRFQLNKKTFPTVEPNMLQEIGMGNVRMFEYVHRNIYQGVLISRYGT